MRKPTMWFLNQFYTNRAVQDLDLESREIVLSVKWKQSAILVVKQKVSVTVELICAYAFSYAKWCFSHDAAQINHLEVLNKSMISRKGGVLLNFIDA